MACEDQISTQNLIDAKKDAVTLGEIATSRSGAEVGGAPISQSINRFGETTDTVQGRLNKLGVIVDDPVRNWTPSLLVNDLRAHRYPATTGDVYIPVKPLPFTTGATFDTDDWALYQGLNENDSINDLSQAYEFATIAEYKAFTTPFPIGKDINTLERETGTGGGASYKVIASGTENTFNIIKNTTLSQSISIQDEGVADLRAIGVNIGDGTAAMQFVFDSYNSFIGHPDDSYTFSSSITIPDDKGEVNYNWNGSIISSGGGFVALNMSETIHASATIGFDVVRGTNDIHISSLDLGTFSVGDLIQIRSDKLWYFDNRGTAKKGETHIVARVDGTHIYTESPIFDTYEIASEALTVIALNKTKMTMKGLSYNNALNTVGGIQFRGLVDSQIEVNIDGAKDLGILLKNSYNSHVKNSNIQNSNESGFGYGVQVSQSTFCTVQSSLFWNCRRGVDFSGKDAVCNFCGVTLSTCKGVDLDAGGSPLYGESSGFGSHGSSFGTYFAENTVYNVENAFILRGCKEIVTNNKVYGSVLSFIASTHGADLTITDNNYESMQSIANPVLGDSRLLTFANIVHSDDRGRTVVRNNKANRIVTNFLQLSMDGGADTANVKGYDITGNEYNVYSNSAGASFTEIDSISGAITMKSCRFKNNSGASIFGGSIIKYDSDITIPMSLTDGCIVEDYPLTLAVDVGAPTGIIQTVRCNILEEKVEVYGHLEFTTTGEVVKFSGFPHPNLGPKQSFAMAAYALSNVIFSYTGNTGNLGKYYLAPTAAAPTAALSAGTYEIGVDFSFNRKTADFMSQ